MVEKMTKDEVNNISQEWYTKNGPDTYLVKSSPYLGEVVYPQSYVNERFKVFLEQLETRNSWGKNQVKELFLETMLGLK